MAAQRTVSPSLCHFLIGRCTLEDGDVKEAMREFEKANALLAHDSLDLAACYSLTGDALRKHGFLTEAVEEYRKIETMAAVAADEPRFVFTVGIHIGLTPSEQGDSNQPSVSIRR